MVRVRWTNLDMAFRVQNNNFANYGKFRIKYSFSE